ncbi:hypothetical protein BN133_903 [Cronobacter dublinensis 582]|nr:hypothetical protein BN133_903 [Cronobacter dublinensis 582]
MKRSARLRPSGCCCSAKKPFSRLSPLAGTRQTITLAALFSVRSSQLISSSLMAFSVGFFALIRASCQALSSIFLPLTMTPAALMVILAPPAVISILPLLIRIPLSPTFI